MPCPSLSPIQVVKKKRVKKVQEMARAVDTEVQLSCHVKITLRSNFHGKTLTVFDRVYTAHWFINHCSSYKNPSNPGNWNDTVERDRRSVLWKLAFSRFPLETVPRTSHRHQADLEVTNVVTDTSTTSICPSCGRAMADTVHTKDVKEKKVTFNEDCRKLMGDLEWFRVCYGMLVILILLICWMYFLLVSLYGFTNQPSKSSLD